VQTYNVKLESPISDSYRCQRAADSLDIDVKKKSIHTLDIECDIKSKFNVGLIVGSSGSGKTTLAKQIFGDDCFKIVLNDDVPIIDQLPKELSYDECAEILAGIGLTSVPCWIRPVKTLSNGQRARAEAALSMHNTNETVIIDEWTSVVDRTVAKVMSHCVQKFARKKEKQIILLSCHYDVIEWLNPDWIIDCNKQEFIDRRLLHLDERNKREKLEFTIKEIDRKSWKYFSKYHYLTERLPGGKLFLYGLFNGNNQVGFQCFANYVPTRKNTVPIFHSNRTVIHPDYAGMGLGIKVINETSKLMKRKGFKIMAKFSSTPIYKSMIKNPDWKLCDIKRQIGKMNVGDSMGRRKTSDGGFRTNIKTYSFEFIG
jgi:ABC-type Mn2+/Zn2+ transport system ATPase subunit